MSEHSTTHFKFTGTRDPQTRKCTILVEDLSTGTTWKLDPRLDLWDHSPDGFEWGYAGSGPAQTALAILVVHLMEERNHPAVMAALGMSVLPTEDDLMGQPLNEYLAVRFHQMFKRRVVSRLPPRSWELLDEDIERLIIEKPSQAVSV